MSFGAFGRPIKGRKSLATITLDKKEQSTDDQYAEYDWDQAGA
jgi:hypothetical protein